MTPEGLVVCRRYRMVVATLPLRAAVAQAPPPAALRTRAADADLLVTTALGVIASMAVAVGLVWAALAVSAT